ncbi:fimbrillin family protein [Barnesiella intestinihominis]|uniref:fimbrillin family protein n=1 Tax=Barnesiella intestinihominis TaxID=487174 RepID=UPI00266D3A8B|nr:fimbrillin family protein [Barnesiella intestinihominis]
MKTFKYIALAALTISFAACTQDEDFIPRGDGDAVKITASIGALQTRVSYDAERNTTFDEGDQIKVENKLRTSKNVATYTLTDEDWNTADAFVWNGASKNEFEAWYPLTASYTTFTIPTDQSSEQLLGAADWMTASSGKIDKPENHTLNLNFHHQLSKVTVNIAKWNSEFDSSEKVIENLKIYSKGTDIEVVYATDGPNVTTSDGALTAITPSAVGHTYTAIVAPAKYATTDKLMTFTVDGQEMTVLATTPKLTNGLNAGLHYSFNLMVGKDAVTLNSVNVTEWANGGTIDGGVAEDESTYTYFPETKTYYVFKAESLPDAIFEASYSAGNIKLMADMELENNVVINKGSPRMLFDLNGHTITVGDNATCVFSIEEIGFFYTFTIDDTSVGKHGKIVAGLNCQSIIHCNTDKVYLTVNNGTLHAAESTTSIIECPQAYSLAINGGTFMGGTYALKGTANSLLITGGCFTGATYDISMGDKTGYLSYNPETGIGATFTDGLSIEGGSTLKNSAAADVGYFAEDGTQTIVTDDQTSINGTVIVKKIETNE